MYTLANLKKLREETGVSYDLCKKALDETQDDIPKATKLLQKWGASVAENKLTRKTGQGAIFSYVHHNRKLASLVTLLCETDFVAKNSDFMSLGNDLAMQTASINPKDEKELLESIYIKDQTKTVDSLLKENILKIGENIKIGQFVTFKL